MSINYDLDQLMGAYADWIAWLKEKETSLAGQLSRMRGKADRRRGTGDGEFTPAESSEISSEGAETISFPSDNLADENVPPSSVPSPPPEDTGTSPSVVDSIPPGEDDTDDWL